MRLRAIPSIIFFTISRIIFALTSISSTESDQEGFAVITTMSSSLMSRIISHEPRHFCQFPIASAMTPSQILITVNQLQSARITLRSARISRRADHSARQQLAFLFIHRLLFLFILDVFILHKHYRFVSAPSCGNQNPQFSVKWKLVLSDYLIFVTTPAPTVRPPSRIAKFKQRSIAVVQ